jgi:ubiquitin carboxyl-terminal hydrolase 25/28
MRHLRSATPKAIIPGANDGDAPPLPPRTTENAKPKIPEAPMGEVEICENASTTSSRTLVNHVEADSLPKSVEEDTLVTADTPAADHAEVQPESQKLTVEELAVELDKPNVGSEQMDVDEVMGNAIDHLRAAFKVSGIGRSESAQDPIEQAFFSTFIDNRKKIGEPDWSQTTRSDRWAIAFPAQSGTLDLYDALANSFDLETLPGNRLSFTTIKRPAPHFHVFIQRLDTNRETRKNVNPIAIPETLYLDRFMHTDDNLSPLAKGRKRKWDIKTRLTEISSTAAEHLETAKSESHVASGPSEPNTQHNDPPEDEVDAFMALDDLNTSVQGSSFPATDMDLDLDTKQLFAKYGIAEPSIASAGGQRPRLRNDEDTALPPFDVKGFWEKFIAEEGAEKTRLIAERNSLFSNSHAVAYRLHAVVCHAGSTASAGHYWVWIHDFERDVWRKYNDTRVSVHPAEFVFEELNTKGEPYYLAYVKADEVQNLVSIPQRRPRTNPPPVPPRIRPGSAQETVMGDADGIETKPIIEHVEDVEMYPVPTAAA